MKTTNRKAARSGTANSNKRTRNSKRKVSRNQPTPLANLIEYGRMKEDFFWNHPEATTEEIQKAHARFAKMAGV